MDILRGRYAEQESQRLPCGTAKMGEEAMSACDPEAGVHGIEGLWIADASIMPRVTNGNIDAPCMMIGEKVARMMLP